MFSGSIKIIKEQSFTFRPSIKTVLLWALLFTLLPLRAIAEINSPTIFAYSLDYRLVRGGRTQYNLMFDRLEQKGVDFELRVQPLIRTHRSIISNKDACIFPANIETHKRLLGEEFASAALLVSEPVDVVSASLFVRANDSDVESIAELENEKIAFWDGLDIKAMLKTDKIYEEPTPNETVRLKMLHAGRVKAMVGFKPDVYIASDILDIDVKESTTIMRDVFPGRPVNLICYENEKNRVLIQRFDVNMKKMKASGELRTILGKHAEIH